MDAIAEIGRNPVSKRTRFSRSVENEQTDARPDGRTCLKLSGAGGDREQNILLVQLSMIRIGSLTRFIHPLSKVLAILLLLLLFSSH